MKRLATLIGILVLSACASNKPSATTEAAAPASSAPTTASLTPEAKEKAEFHAKMAKKHAALAECLNAGKTVEQCHQEVPCECHGKDGHGGKEGAQCSHGEGKHSCPMCAGAETCSKNSACDGAEGGQCPMKDMGSKAKKKKGTPKK